MKNNEKDLGVSKKQFPLMSELFLVNSSNIEDYKTCLQQLVLSNELNALMLKMLNEAITKAKTSDAMFNSLNCPIVLWADEYKLVTFSPTEVGPLLGASRTNNNLISNTATDSIIGFIGEGQEDITHYTFECNNLDVFTPGIVLEKQSVLKIGHGDVCHIKPGNNVYNYGSSKKTLGVISVASAKNQNGLTWLFDQTSLVAEGCASASSLATRLQYVIKLLLAFPIENSKSILLTLAQTSSFHFVRWEAIKAMLQVDFTQGYHLLKVASENEHIHIKNAATKTLVNLHNRGYGIAS